MHAQSKVTPRGSARFVIFVMLEGGQSHVDSWDLKEGKWTPQNFDIREIAPGVKWPMALFPQLAKQRERYSLIRSMEAWDSVHFRAQYYVQSGHMMNPALQKELPPIGTVVAYESAARRQPTDTLPGYVAVNVTQSQAGLLSCGFLPATYTPFHIDTTSGIGAISLDDEGRKKLLRRWELLKKVDERLRNDSSLAAKAYRDYHNHYEGAVSMMSDQRASQVFQIDTADHDRYGKTQVGDGCILARNLVEADAGTHFVLVNHRDWDHHNRIYNDGNHYKLCKEIDTALSSLLDDLAARKRADGRTLLDETMVVCFGEFGRTPGELSAANGRDHYQYALTGLFAGGGVQGGRVIGKTDDLGAKVDRAGLECQAVGLHGGRRHDDLLRAGHRLVQGHRRSALGARVPLHRAVRVEADDQEPGDLDLVRVTRSGQDRANRWGYYGLYGLDFAFLCRHRPLWDIVVVALLIGVGVSSITSLVPVYRRLARHARKLALPAIRSSRRPASAINQES